jgi:hypothetical protein
MTTSEPLRLTATRSRSADGFTPCRARKVLVPVCSVAEANCRLALAVAGTASKPATTSAAMPPFHPTPST